MSPSRFLALFGLCLVSIAASLPSQAQAANTMASSLMPVSEDAIQLAKSDNCAPPRVCLSDVRKVSFSKVSTSTDKFGRIVDFYRMTLEDKTGRYIYARYRNEKNMDLERGLGQLETLTGRLPQAPSVPPVVFENSSVL